MRITNEKTFFNKVPQQTAVMLLGTCMLAFAYYHINYANHLSEGGFVGLALLGKYVFGLSPAWSVFLLDVPVLIAAWLIRGWRFAAQALLGAATFSLFYSGFEWLSPPLINLQGNLAVASVLSGVLTGLGAGMVMRVGGATGGDDILSLLISQWKGWKLGSVFFVSDCIVLLLSLFYLPFKETMYTIFAVWIAGQTITLTVTFRLRPAAESVGKIQPAAGAALTGVQRAGQSS
ncbi:YitT family protein [Paenibacillus sp. P96]|uniref:YitT family protein n=1 Tax=Paenibacillus zeirhizosphaerae TaxID=2987519 RepID=A0ABT9FPX9_9BACL|nr:YitT family protein [Paenibacillus sp. P96]MDP4096794.1 YitT family protein [Paenibacillus sp. P96]